MSCLGILLNFILVYNLKFVQTTFFKKMLNTHILISIILRLYYVNFIDKFSIWI